MNTFSRLILIFALLCLQVVNVHAINQYHNSGGAYISMDSVSLHVKVECGQSLAPGTYLIGIDGSSDNVGRQLTRQLHIVWDGMNAPAEVVLSGVDTTTYFQSKRYTFTPRSYQRVDILGSPTVDFQQEGVTLPIRPIVVASLPPPEERVAHVPLTIYIGKAPPDPGDTTRETTKDGGTSPTGGTSPNGGTGAGGETGSGGGPRPDCGMATYSFQRMLASLCVTDTPLTYRPAFGPAVDFTLTYNHRDERTAKGDDDVTSFGSKWTSDWISYIQVNSDPDAPTPPPEVVEVNPGGGSTAYAYKLSGFEGPPRQWAVLVNTGTGTFEKQFADGSKLVYGKSSVPTYPKRIFLTKIVDPSGNQVTLTYAAGNQIKLTSVTDAAGKTTTLEYADPAYPLHVTSVTDPFGRKAILSYSGEQLHSIKDPVGIESVFTYQVDPHGSDPAAINFIETLQTPYGTTTFSQGGDGSRWWVQATDALGATERVETRLGKVATLPAAEAEVPTGFTSRNINLDRNNSYYWDKQAMSLMPGAATDPAFLDYSKATITHWLKSREGATLSGIPGSLKRPLESRVWYAYENQFAFDKVGKWKSPSEVARLVDASPGPGT